IGWWVRNQEIVDHIRRRRHNPHYLSSVYFDTHRLNLSTRVEDVVQEADVALVCIPSAYLLPTFDALPTHVFNGKMVLSAIKGILPNDAHQLLNEYLNNRFALDISRYYTVMGPCHAEEVANEKLSYLTFSGEDTEMAENIASHFRTDYLNTVVNHDVWGTQYAAVLKNIYAVGSGIAHGLEYGDNFQSVYITNAAEEMVRFLRRVMEYKQAPDAGKIQYASSVYLGDLLVTCYSLYSRNRTFGNMIGKGYSVKVAQLEMNMVAEGYPASRGLYEVNQNMGSDMPIAATIYKVLWEGLPAAAGFTEIEKHLR
ncbi:MAG TPA: NAD(P)H-dependent glycerol-3-phosphate dehydrogenase, partial [Phnomibacter sp.]|nr:NAD(P)H-dependent glycerol-3-phosphate dehydrogenase [Phnomibacter sp.]